MSLAGKAQAERSNHDDLVTSLALCAFGMTTYLETIPVNFIDDNSKTPSERLLAPVRLRNLKSFGGDVEEDMTWLMK